MKKLKRTIFIILIPFILVLGSFLYINTYVSEKYETQMEGIREVRKKELVTRKKNLKNRRIIIVLTSIALVSILTVMLINDNKKQRTLTK